MRLLLTFLFCAVLQCAMASILNVAEVSELTSDISARSNAVYDSDGKRCALIKVRVLAKNVVCLSPFEKSISNENEFWFYVKPGEKRLKLKIDGQIVEIVSSKFNIKKFEDGKTYLAVIEGGRRSDKTMRLRQADASLKIALRLSLDPEVPLDTLSVLGWPIATLMLKKDLEYGEQIVTLLEVCQRKYTHNAFSNAPRCIRYAFDTADSQELQRLVHNYNQIAMALNCQPIQINDDNSEISGTFLSVADSSAGLDESVLVDVCRDYAILEMHEVWNKIVKYCSQKHYMNLCSNSDSVLEFLRGIDFHPAVKPLMMF